MNQNIQVFKICKSNSYTSGSRLLRFEAEVSLTNFMALDKHCYLENKSKVTNL